MDKEVNDTNGIYNITRKQIKEIKELEEQTGEKFSGGDMFDAKKWIESHRLIALENLAKKLNII